jgi:hypothetical protein
MISDITPALAKSRLACAVWRGDPPERVAELRRTYHACKASDFLVGLISADRLLPEHRTELADLLVRGGDADVAA